MPRVAIVTGGGSGIGRALGAALVARGDQVVLADAAAVADQLTSAGSGAATAAVVDVRDADAVIDLITETGGRHGGLDLLANNAEIPHGRTGRGANRRAPTWDRMDALFMHPILPPTAVMAAH